MMRRSLLLLVALVLACMLVVVRAQEGQ
jgi:predicted small secreted protein